MNNFYFYGVGLGVLFVLGLVVLLYSFKAVWVSQWAYSMTGQGSRNQKLKTIFLCRTDLIILPFFPPFLVWVQAIPTAYKKKHTTVLGNEAQKQGEALGT